MVVGVFCCLGVFGLCWFANIRGTSDSVDDVPQQGSTAVGESETRVTLPQPAPARKPTKQHPKHPQPAPARKPTKQYPQHRQHPQHGTGVRVQRFIISSYTRSCHTPNTPNKEQGNFFCNLIVVLFEGFLIIQARELIYVYCNTRMRVESTTNRHPKSGIRKRVTHENV